MDRQWLQGQQRSFFDRYGGFGSSVDDVMVIDDDQDEGTADSDVEGNINPGQFDRDHRPFIERFKNLGQTSRTPIVIDDEQNEEAEVELTEEIAEVIDLSVPSPSLTPDLQQAQRITRNAPIAADLIRPSCNHNGMTIEKRDTVEFDGLDEANLLATFLKVDLVWMSDGHTKLRGILYARTHNTKAKLPYKRNEVVQVLHVDENDRRPWDEQAAVDIMAETVIGKRDMRSTNALFSQHALKASQYASKLEAYEIGPLMNRWKLVTFYKDALQRRAGKQRGVAIIHLRAEDVPEAFRVPDDVVTNNSRGGIVRGGSYNPGQLDGVVFDLESALLNPNSNQIRLPQGRFQQYTYADIFCGAGGTSRGAKSAGFRLKMACDIWEAACLTYQRSFPECDIRQLDVHHLIQYLSNTEQRPDNDDTNLAALFSCFQIIKKLKPRIVMLEQTFGILHRRFEHYFNLLNNCFTNSHYSVSYRVIHMETWGVPQPRKRLIIIASGPGEKLPSFPPPKPGRPTVAKALATIGRRATLHNPEELKRGGRAKGTYPKAPWDPEERAFTLREFAALQTFPSHHRFKGQAIKKQIGNAVPPAAAEWLCRYILQHLLRDDGMEARVEDDDVVVLD
ncbi:S-adenosyl-L-methionine-dependent methyltransferase [Pseudomassariella vexata]|uniref:DNA (cytosine-5-)-methyltransferase n=1 Tax=Pseudomassariella vexata TaxID=1141098 RepID=A0A1Y2DN33_9PEZI|nr:S-adenosyl-L-methionine-dependent methyltransferase [Pseudomassariella vexata]ORY60579.1 S-adenosyl-L-methionine-dependent methyltransferase [Pseudomassariella vexata]